VNHALPALFQKLLVQSATPCVKIAYLEMHKKTKDFHTVCHAYQGSSNICPAKQIVLPVKKIRIKTWWERQAAKHAHQVEKQKTRAVYRAVFVQSASLL